MGTGSANYTGAGYFLDARIGNVFTLFGTGSGTNPPPFPTAMSRNTTGGDFVGLDLSGHLAYISNWTNPFSTSAGFFLGRGATQFADVGARGRLFLSMNGYGLHWMPYIGGAIDHVFAYSSVLNIPAQPAVPAGDNVYFHVGRTFGTAMAGLDVAGASGVTCGVQAFYTASSDTNLVGGKAYLKIPFSYTTAAVARY